MIGIVLASVLFSAACSKGGKDSPPAAVSQGVEEVRPKECMDGPELSAFGTRFAREDVWAKLPETKTLGETFGDYALQAVEVTEFGVIGSLGWHEGPNVCVQHRDGELWAQVLGAGDAKWEGPFIAVDAKGGFERAYFNRIFGKACYQTVEGEDWCFGDGSIQIGGRALKTAVLLDTSEMPEYGIPVTVEGEPAGFWMFVRVQEQWHVFKDEVVTQEGHVDIDPAQFPPWRVLRLKH
ncbi:hypothetical protein [Rhodoferax saidenbachensis]|uniref:hypothetical protein n=1 Tax=Rhodoferax saidenbachensis TaxID=1484693 RepID=UPI00286C0D18|nr:hypothetical protein [Rhodoferax saidenbachensis]